MNIGNTTADEGFIPELERTHRTAEPKSELNMTMQSLVFSGCPRCKMTFIHGIYDHHDVALPQVWQPARYTV